MIDHEQSAADMGKMATAGIGDAALIEEAYRIADGETRLLGTTAHVRALVAELRRIENEPAGVSVRSLRTMLHLIAHDLGIPDEHALSNPVTLTRLIRDRIKPCNDPDPAAIAHRLTGHAVTPPLRWPPPVPPTQPPNVTAAMKLEPCSHPTVDITHKPVLDGTVSISSYQATCRTCGESLHVAGSFQQFADDRRSIGHETFDVRKL